jgi:hypothetical protein
MVSEAYTDQIFDIEKCRAKLRGAGDLVDCLVPRQATFCGYSQFFGNSYFCKHSRRNEFIETSRKAGVEG